MHRPVLSIIAAFPASVGRGALNESARVPDVRLVPQLVNDLHSPVVATARVVTEFHCVQLPARTVVLAAMRISHC